MTSLFYLMLPNWILASQHILLWFFTSVHFWGFSNVEEIEVVFWWEFSAYWLTWATTATILIFFQSLHQYRREPYNLFIYVISLIFLGYINYSRHTVEKIQVLLIVKTIQFNACMCICFIYSAAKTEFFIGFKK